MSEPPSAGISAFSPGATTVTELRAPDAPGGAAPSSAAARTAVAAELDRRCLPPALPFARFAMLAIVLATAAVSWSSWRTMRALAAVERAAAAPPPAPPEAAPSAAQLVDDTWFGAACGDHPERAVPLGRARARAFAAAGDPAAALAAWDAVLRAGRGDATLDDALGRAEALAALERWDEALAALARVDLAAASSAAQQRAIALDARCRLARARTTETRGAAVGARAPVPRL